MKRVGIMTLYYKTYNFGAQLQAYALQKTIEKLGYNCEQISFRWSREETLESYELASIDKESFLNFSGNIKHSAKVYDAETIHECIEDYDVFICGSDQVWGVENSMPILNLPIMSLSFVPNNKIKFAYAASLGGARANYKTEEVLKRTLPKLDAISVRESSAKKYIEELSGKEVKSVLDPVMLLSKEELSELADKGGEHEPYIFYYTAGQNKKHETFVCTIAQEKKLQIRRSGYINGEKIGPGEFVGLIRDAEYVITDSFHASVLSILFHKKFLVLPIDKVPTDKSKNIRLRDLLGSFCLRQRFLEEEKSQQISLQKALSILNTPIEYAQAEEQLDILREQSICFLVRNLQTEKEELLYLKPQNQCTGCGICMLSCPNKCISMVEDELGFVYPQIDRDNCNSCGICEKACTKKQKPSCDFNTKMVALTSKNDTIRQNSSSGGAFYEMAGTVLERGGIAVACRFDDGFKVCHGICTRLDELDAFCRSKYVQSNAYNRFADIKSVLDSGKRVLFAGTPCQVHALTSYLECIPDNLYLIDLVCGGVTAPALWEKYLKEIESRGPVSDISMRHKDGEYLKPEGFPAFSMRISYPDHEDVRKGQEDLFLSSRLNFYRDVCYSCKYKGTDRDSDITIGDFCGMRELLPESYDGKGTTLGIIHSRKGEELLGMCHENLSVQKLNHISMDDILEQNIMISGQMKRSAQFEYLRTILPDAGMERICYENKWLDEFVFRERLQRDFYHELIRDELLKKLMKFQCCNLWIEDCPNVSEKVYIYGAGKLGRAIISGMREEPAGFIDGNPHITNCYGIPVFHIGDEALGDILGDGSEVSVIVTPVWDFCEIQETLRQVYPKLNIISLQQVVGDIWL